MTCIIGLETKDGVIVGADSQVTSGHEHGAIRSECAKVIRKSNHLIACAGVARLSDVMRYHLTLPRYDGGSVHRHAVTVIVPAIRKALTKHLPERDRDTQTRMIIGVGGCVLTIDNWLHVLMVNRGYATEGSGGEVALGALHATSALAPRVRVYLALEAACSLLTDCGAPFVIKEMKK